MKSMQVPGTRDATMRRKRRGEAYLDDVQLERTAAGEQERKKNSAPHVVENAIEFEGTWMALWLKVFSGPISELKGRLK